MCVVCLDPLFMPITRHVSLHAFALPVCQAANAKMAELEQARTRAEDWD